MRRIWNRLFPECAHEDTLVVRSVGIERTVCEKCGHLSFSIAPNLADGVARTYVQEPELPKVSGL